MRLVFHRTGKSRKTKYMFYQLFQLVFLLGFSRHLSSESDELLCYSCKGTECEDIRNEDGRKIICNRKTELCWAGFINQQPYRTCASRYCTPNDISLDSDIHIETCCRSNLCNSAALSPTSYPTGTTTIGYFIDRIVHMKSYDIVDEKSNAVDTITWDRLLYDKAFSTRLASISSLLLFLIPLLLVLLL